MRSTVFALLIAIAAIISSCSDSEKVYKIAVSQCSPGEWRDKVNQEMQAAQYIYDERAEVEIFNAWDDIERQIRQIDSLTDAGIDLLVVAPIASAPLTEAITRTREKGIPVVFFDRKAETDDYTAFIGGDNVAAGQACGEYALELVQSVIGRKPQILEITALMDASPVIERHEGFKRAMSGHQEVDYTCINSDWSWEGVYQILKQKNEDNNLPDVVFCHTDYMSQGAYRFTEETGTAKKIKIVSIDGLIGEGQGLEAVEKGLLAGTYIYPTHGEKVIRLALDILVGKPYERDNYLLSLMATPKNIHTVSMNNYEMMTQIQNLVLVEEKMETFHGLYNSQRKMLIASIVSIVFLALALVIFWRAGKQIKRAHRRMKQVNEEQTHFYTNASHQLKTPLTLIAGPVKQLLDRNVLKGDDLSLLEIVGRNVANLEMLVSNVLNFRREVQGTVSDETVVDALVQAVPKDIVQEGHLEMLNQEDTDELPNILIVEDNDDMRRYLRTLLADRFYVLEASDGQNGLRLARESVPDLIVSDVMMPVMDGLQLCKHLKEDLITSHIPVILLTARSEERQQMEGYESGADAYLTKPFSADLLVSRIYNILANRRQLRNLFDNNKQENTPADVKLTTQDKLFMDQLKEAVNSNMSNPNLKMDELGEQLGISRVQLYRKVKTLTGLSPVELLRQMRLQKAKILLNSTTKTVAEIAYEVGFNSSSYFATCFKKQFGKLPMEQRE